MNKNKIIAAVLLTTFIFSIFFDISQAKGVMNMYCIIFSGMSRIKHEIGFIGKSGYIRKESFAKCGGSINFPDDFKNKFEGSIISSNKIVKSRLTPESFISFKNSQTPPYKAKIIMASNFVKSGLFNEDFIIMEEQKEFNNPSDIVDGDDITKTSSSKSCNWYGSCKTTTTYEITSYVITAYGNIYRGHYVKSQISNLKSQNLVKLYQAKDLNKDQSYFLWTLTQKQLKHCLFPIGDYLKSEVRKIAKKANLPTAGKKDSQGICFLGQVNLSDFLKKYIPEKRGDILLITDINIPCDRKKCYQNNIKYKKIGKHKGAHFYTIGQRHINANFQFPISNFQENRKPYYVAEKNVKKNTIVVAEGDDNPALYKKEIKLTDVNFINPVNSQILENIGINILTRVRYRQPLVSAKLKIKNLKLKIEFNEPIKFIAPGQSAVFYNEKGEMLGGGVIL